MHFTNSVQFLHLAGQGRGFSGTSGIRSAEMSVCGIRTCAEMHIGVHSDRSKRRVLTWTVWKCLSLSLARGVACLMTVRACLTKLLAGADIPANSDIRILNTGAKWKHPVRNALREMGVCRKAKDGTSDLAVHHSDIGLRRSVGVRSAPRGSGHFRSAFRCCMPWAR